MPHPLIIIPARLRSTRLPGKPLADILGAPMIVHVVRRAQAASLGPVVVATEDDAIAHVVEQAGGTAIMTGDHPSGTDRIAAALATFDPTGQYDIVVNLQGDEPEIPPEVLRAVIAPFDDPAAEMTTLAAPLMPEERDDPNAVKVWGALGGTAGDTTLWQQAPHPEELAKQASRRMGHRQAVSSFETPLAAAPQDEGRGKSKGHFERICVAGFSRAMPQTDLPVWRHVGVYAWRRAALMRFVALPPSMSEQRERLEQLRALDAGMRIDAVAVDACPRGVDTPADLAAVRARFAKGSCR